MTEYRYRNVYPGGPCTLVVRGEHVARGEFSAWGERLPAGTRELDRGWLQEEALDVSPSEPVVPAEKSKPKRRNSRSKG